MAMKRYYVLLLSAVLLLFTKSTHGHVGEIIELTDATFEHQTQASTGMTTGSWFIFFKAAQCAHCKKLAPEFQHLANDEALADAGIVFATVDVPSNRRTAVRFGVRGFPTLIYLHKGKTYPFHGNRRYHILKEFLLEGVPAMEGLTMPAPLGAVTEFLQTIQAAVLELYDLVNGKSGVAGIGIVVLLALFFGIFIMLLAMCFMPATKVKKKKA